MRSSTGEAERNRISARTHWILETSATANIQKSIFIETRFWILLLFFFLFIQAKFTFHLVILCVHTSQVSSQLRIRLRQFSGARLSSVCLCADVHLHRNESRDDHFGHYLHLNLLCNIEHAVWDDVACADCRTMILQQSLVSVFDCEPRGKSTCISIFYFEESTIEICSYWYPFFVARCARVTRPMNWNSF